jgi:hypothetical protein
MISLFSLLLLAMAGCNSDDKANIKKPDSNDNRVMLSSDGVGPINASTPFNMHQVTLAFQDYSVTEYTQFTKNNSSPVIRVSEDGKPILLINPDSSNKKIFSIFILSNKIGNALGHEVGSLYNTIYTYQETEPCIAGSEEFAGKVLCMAPKTENILYVFSGSWDGPKDETPPTAILAEWKLDSIVWKP